LARPMMLMATALAALSIFPGSALAAEGDKLAVAETSWKPRDNEVAAAQTALKAYLGLDAVSSQWADNTPESPGEARLRHGLAPKFNDYWLRATGVTGRQGELAAKISNRPIIRMDGFCKVSGDTWKDAHFVIDDGGGDCYFHAEYDLAGRAIVFFDVNR
jgi:hypothetical protein